MSDLQEHLDRPRDKHGVVGCSLAVLYDGEVYTAASGLLNLATSGPSRRRSRHAVAVAALAASVALTSCGSTVANQSAATGAAPLGGDGLSAPGTALARDGSVVGPDGAAVGPDGAAVGPDGAVVGPDGAVVGPDGAVKNPQDGAGGGPAFAAAPGPGRAAQVPVQPGSAAESGRGFDSKSVRLGIVYRTGSEEAFKAFGFSGITFGDQKALSEAFIKRLNARGGILGRKVVPVYHEVPMESAFRDPESVRQRICADFTQDRPVFAVANLPGEPECLAKARVPSSAGGGQVPADTKYFNDRAPYYYYPAIMNADSVWPLLLDRLTKRSFLNRTSQIGVFYADTPEQRRIKDSLIRQIRSRGLTVAAEFGYNSQDSAMVASSAGNAVLPFRSKNVDRVISLDANIALVMIAAEQQGYRPKYGLTTYMNLASVQESVPPKEQLVGSMGIGWQPVNDVNAQQRIALSGTAECEQAMKDSGQQPTGSAVFILSATCDSIRLLVQGAQAGGGFTGEAVRRGITATGATFKTALNFRNAYGSGAYAGAGAARDIAFDTSCSCFKYSSAALYDVR